MSLSRRRLLGTSSAGVLAAALPGLAAEATAAPDRWRDGRPARRPNILWFLTEDSNPYVGAYGDKIAHTPTIDRLAADGLQFDVAYCPAPVCAPSRFTYLTGVNAESVGPAHHMRATATLPSFMKGFPEYLRGAGYYTTNNSKTDYNATVDMAATWDASSPTAHWRDRPEGAPFFAQFTTMTTHESQLFAPTTGRVTPDQVTIPPFLPDTPETRQDAASFHNRLERMDGELAARLAELDAGGVAEDTIVFFFGDNGGVLPFSKRFSREDGHRIPLVVHLSPRWAHLAPDHARRGHVRTPVGGVDLPATALAVAGVARPSHFQGQPLLGRRAEPQRYTFGQRSRMDERYDLQRTVRTERYIYTRNYVPWRPYGQYVAYMFQQRGYQVWLQAHLDGTLDEVQERFWQQKPHEELHDLDRDPDQVDNLVGDRRHRKLLDELRGALDDHLLETHDNGFLPEGHPLEGWEASRRRGAYPLKRILGVAATAARRDPADGRRLLRLLRDDHDVVRWWAAQGLLGLGLLEEPSGPAFVARHAADLERAFTAESSVPVRLALAEALGRLGSAEHVTWLAGRLADPAPRVRLMAVNALTYLDAALVRPHRAAVAAQEPPRADDEYTPRAARYLGRVLDGTFDPAVPVL